ncbi:MAG: DeoR/GlpR family DNA-binding transcription regulator [Anaerolineaceae bacterium]|nr:DeoR/GlpR family DNA-binding transcription regulator [Anaerolineaceae bacterium]
MLKGERQREILKVIENHNQVHVNELAQRFAVSAMTIRRDLEELHQKGMIQRIHGGAVTWSDGHKRHEPPVFERASEHQAEKRQIAKKVAGMVKEGEKIFLGSGTTTLAIAEELANRRNLTVLTNAITIVNCLVPAPGITVIVLGGFLRRMEMSLIGHFTESALENLRVDKVIIGIRGIDPVHGLTSDNMQELFTDQAILRISKTIIVAADYSKFCHIAAIRTAPITAVTKFVTDQKTSPDVVTAIRRMGIEVIQA